METTAEFPEGFGHASYWVLIFKGVFQFFGGGLSHPNRAVKESALRMLLLFILRHFGAAAGSSREWCWRWGWWGLERRSGQDLLVCQNKLETTGTSIPGLSAPSARVGAEISGKSGPFYFKRRAFWGPAPTEKRLLFLLAATNTEYPQITGATDKTALKYLQAVPQGLGTCFKIIIELLFHLLPLLLSAWPSFLCMSSPQRMVLYTLNAPTGTVFFWKQARQTSPRKVTFHNYYLIAAFNSVPSRLKAVLIQPGSSKFSSQTLLTIGLRLSRDHQMLFVKHSSQNQLKWRQNSLKLLPLRGGLQWHFTDTDPWSQARGREGKMKYQHLPTHSPVQELSSTKRIKNKKN